MKPERRSLRYRLTIERGSFTEGDAATRGEETCDALLLITTKGDGTGWDAVEIAGVDGRSKMRTLLHRDLFKFFLVLAKMIIRDEEVPFWQRMICESVLKQFTHYKSGKRK